ncbi:unnamed protein product [Heligmosomoides polygyrus]|uniref:Uncharacterized protein n=1 Tax=Heligmosomoides polygyrus TaxID=6339 RepID=A0A183GLG5_HELPZ|nr:unnamed protein product [Heligmosomoides polygyrus]
MEGCVNQKSDTFCLLVLTNNDPWVTLSVTGGEEDWSQEMPTAVRRMRLEDMPQTSSNVRRDSEDVPKRSSNVRQDSEDVLETSSNVHRNSE